MDYPWIIHGLDMDYQWNIHGLSMDYHGLSMDYQWIIHGKSMSRVGPHRFVRARFLGGLNPVYRTPLQKRSRPMLR